MDSDRETRAAPGDANVHSACSEALDAAEAALAPGLPEADAGEDTAIRARALRRMSTGLRPRTAGGAGATTLPVLTVALLGPNNSGKSALFNTLCDADLSPSAMTGGLTEHPVRADASRAAGLPEGVVLVDLPDFDSVKTAHREACQDEVLAADLVAAVVTPQTYRNAQVVHTLQQTVGLGLPWVLVYNGAPASRPELAAAHLDVLEADVGIRADARFQAAWDLAVQDGAPLRLVPAGGPAAHTELLDVAADSGRARALRRRALAAGMAGLAADLSALSSLRRRAGSDLAASADDVARECKAAAKETARVVPADLVLEAFRQALDQGSPLHGAVRALARKADRQVRRLGGAARRGLARLVGVRQTVEGGAADPFRAAEARRLAEVAGRLMERLARSHPDAFASAGGAGERLEDLLRAHSGLAVGSTEFHEACVRAFREELGSGGRASRTIQWTVTALETGPLTLGVALALATGGLHLGDLVYAGSLATGPLFERLVRLVSQRVLDRIGERWREERAAVLAPALEQAIAGGLPAGWRARAEDLARAASLAEQASEAAQEATGLLRRPDDGGEAHP